MKKLKKSDFLFVLALSLGLLYHLFYLFIALFSSDESFYITIPFRLIDGDSLIRHEWHLTQFSALFTYLPVYIWTAIKGSTEGIFLFLRCLYLIVHTVITAVIYLFFRKKFGKWAIIASMLFYIQIPHRMLAISYQSMFVIFLLLFTFCLISIYEKQSTRFYIFAGICFGCCCVNNPLFCVAFLLYLLLYAFWSNQEKVKDYIIAKKVSKEENKIKKLTNKQKKELKKEFSQTDIFSNLNNYNCFFSKNALLWFSCGIFIIALISVIFYFITGGKLTSIPQNIGNLLNSSEYSIASFSIIDKFVDTFTYFTKITLGTAFLLPIIFIAILTDKKRTTIKHRLTYLSISLLWSIIYIIGFIVTGEFYACAVSLPFFLISTVCYLLTENKNKMLFYCMYLPSLIAAVIQYFAANTHMAAFGLVFVVNNVVGVFFAMDLFKEMKSEANDGLEQADVKKSYSFCRNLIIISVCVQILFNGIYYQHNNQPTIKDPHIAQSGPCEGLYFSEDDYNTYSKALNDLDIIKSRSRESDPVLIVSYNNWMYLYLDRPMATYTTWYRGAPDTTQLAAYYEANPKKIPKYVYIESSDLQSKIIERNMEILDDILSFTREDLSNGVLLTVNYCLV